MLMFPQRFGIRMGCFIPRKNWPIGNGLGRCSSIHCREIASTNTLQSHMTEDIDHRRSLLLTRCKVDQPIQQSTQSIPLKCISISLNPNLTSLLRQLICAQARNSPVRLEHPNLVRLRPLARRLLLLLLSCVKQRIPRIQHQIHRARPEYLPSRIKIVPLRSPPIGKLHLAPCHRIRTILEQPPWSQLIHPSRTLRNQRERKRDPLRGKLPPRRNNRIRRRRQIYRKFNDASQSPKGPFSHARFLIGNASGVIAPDITSVSHIAPPEWP
mmetsp:Transcript_31757/g.68594  ORF Transcript_31757/g.68594 Transcript_31757/m.68594 type:complete len:269 (-) Transcript_31757:602-1408(-)